MPPSWRASWPSLTLTTKRAPISAAGKASAQHSSGARPPTISNSKAERWQRFCASSPLTDGANPLQALGDYSRFVAERLGQLDLTRSTVAVWSDSPYTGIAEGQGLFANGLRLRLRAEVDFEAGRIGSYGYEVYRGDERWYWQYLRQNP